MLTESASTLSRTLGRLSSGSRIVSPEDDAAGLAQTIKFDAQIHRNSAVLTNLGNVVSFSQTQDGYLQKVQKAVDRMGEIAVLAQDATKTDDDRTNYDAEFQQLFNPGKYITASCPPVACLRRMVRNSIREQGRKPVHMFNAAIRLAIAAH